MAVSGPPVKAVGTSFKNPVTGEPHQAAISLN
jgi:hypothetical protein